MPSYQHKRLLETITRIDQVPAESVAYAEWIKGGQHLDFLCKNAAEDEIVVYGSGNYTFVHSMVVSNQRLQPLDQEDLLLWNCGLTENIAGYVYGGDNLGMWIDRGGLAHAGSKTLDGAMSLIFARTFEGWSGEGRDYFEVHQEYTHLAGLHWRPDIAGLMTRVILSM